MTSATIAQTKEGTVSRSRVPKVFRRLPLHVALIAVLFIWLVPTIGVFINSFRSADAITSTGWWTVLTNPSGLTLDNYNQVLSQEDLGSKFLNSLYITIPATLIPTMLAAFTAYAFAWMKFPGRTWLFLGLVALIVIPLQTTFIPIGRLFNNFFGTNINGSFLAVWLAHTAYGLPFAIYLLRNFMGSLPREVFESAYIDGASPVTAFFRLALPMSVPAIASLVIFQFVFVWNDLLVALIFIGPNTDNQPLTQALASLVSSFGSGWQYLAAAGFIAMIVPLVVFLSLQRFFVRGISAGSVKG
jgi:alpha-glucoside transport system permease protein